MAKAVAEAVVIAVAEAVAKPVAVYLEFVLHFTLAMDILSQPGLTRTLLLYPGCTVSDRIPKLCVTPITYQELTTHYL